MPIQNSSVKRLPHTVPKSHDAAGVETDHYKILVDSVQDYAIFFLDTEGNIMSWNKGAQRNKGYTPNEIIGKHFSIFYMQEDIDARKPERELELAMRLGRVEDEDWRVRKDGSKFWANVVITCLYDEAGKHIGFAKVTRDLTERKAQEDNLRAANIKLKKQQHALEQMNKSKDEFISLASHQLRTPATAVKQLLGMLLEGMYGAVPANVYEVINKANVSNDRQINIINSLLKVAQLDAGKVIINKSRTDLCELLDGVAKEYAETSAVHHQKISVDMQVAAPFMFEVDYENIRMAVSNLMDNALKYTHEGGHIKLSLRTDDEMIVIDVTDSGVGINPTDIPKLFGRFVRIPNDMTNQVIGSGLGLYWVKKVIELHGGSIEVISQPGTGTTFSIKLPMGTPA